MDYTDDRLMNQLFPNGYSASLFFHVKQDFSATKIGLEDAYATYMDYREVQLKDFYCTIALSSACALGGYRVRKKYHS